MVKPAVRTYSKNRRRVTENDTVFVKTGLQSLQQNKLSPEDEVKGRKKKGNKRPASDHPVEQSKSCKGKKAVLKDKTQSNRSTDQEPEVEDPSLDDVLFVEDLPVKRGRKTGSTSAKRTQKTKGASAKASKKEKSVKDGRTRKKNGPVTKDNLSEQETVSFTVSGAASQELPLNNDDSGAFGDGEDNIGEEMNKVPPADQMKGVDKVNDWLAKSSKSTSPNNDSSKEIWRQEVQFTGEERRKTLFPEEFYENLNNVLKQTAPPPVKTNKLVKDKFLSQLALTDSDQLFGFKSLIDDAENLDENSDDGVPLTYTETQTGIGSQFTTQTGTQYTTQTGTQSTTETGTLLITQTGTQSSIQTGTRSSLQTGTQYSTETGTQSSTHTDPQFFTETGTQFTTQTGTKSTYETGTHSPSDTQFGTQTGTESFTQSSCKTDLQSDTATRTKTPQHTSDLNGPSHVTRRKRGHQTVDNSSQHDEKSATSKTDQLRDTCGEPNKQKRKRVSAKRAAVTPENEQTIHYKDPQVQKYFCSTLRRSMCANKADFPSELSSVEDSLRQQIVDEKTPRRSAKKFKVPGSPVKVAAHKEERKGTFQPKNSTKLFTSGFVEIIDVIPQMSTIVYDPDPKPPLEKQFNKKAQEPKRNLQNVKTSTPNKVESQELAFQFEADISSVKMDSDEEELVLLKETREVNSEECIHLSDVMISFHEDDMKADDHTVVQVANESGLKDNKAKQVGRNTSSIMTKTEKTTYAITYRERKTQAVNQKTREVANKSLPRKSPREKKGLETEKYSDDGISQNWVNMTSKESINLSKDKTTNDKSVGKNPSEFSADTENVVGQKKSNRKKESCNKPNKSMLSNNNKLLESMSVNSCNINPYDIDESAKNVPSPCSQKLARRQITKPSKEEISVEPDFDPKGMLKFSSLVSSSSDGKSCSRLHLENQMPMIAEDKTRNKMEVVSDVPVDIPICSLHYNFTCPPAENISVFKYIVKDTRTYKEIRDSVPKDVLWF